MLELSMLTQIDKCVNETYRQFSNAGSETDDYLLYNAI